MFAVAAATVAGWLLLFVVLLILPPASQPSPDENAPPSAEPPVVVSLLAGRLDRDGFRVTLADLAARGWFRLSGTPGPASPVMCVVPAETPAEPLAPYERRVMAHVAVRAGARGEVPAPALAGSGGGGAPGRAADGGARLQAYAAALGRAPGVTAVFAAAEENVVWSSYRGSWQQLPIESNAWPWPRAIAFMLAVIFGPIAFFGGVIYLFVANLGWLAVRVIGLAVGAALVGVAVWAARKLAPRFAEFDGQVIRQTFTENDEGPDEYRVVVDDGVRATAWDLQVPGGAWPVLKPGTFVHARVNLYNREVSIHGAEPAEDGPGGDEAALIRLLSLVADRLPGLVPRP